MREQEGKHAFQARMPFYPLLAKVERGYIDKHFPLGQEGTLLWGEQFVCFPLGLGGVARVKVAHWDPTTHEL